MVEQSHIDQRQGLLEGLGKDPVRLAGFRVTAWVIVHCDDGPAVEYQGPLDYFPWVDAGAVQGAAKQFLKSQYAVLGVKPINGKSKLPEALPFQESSSHLANHWPEALKATLLPSVDRSLSLKTPLYSLSPWKP